MNTGKLAIVSLVGATMLGVISARAQTAPAPASPTDTPPSAEKIAVPPLQDRGTPVLEGLQPEPGGLTSAEVARRALAVSPSVKEKRAQVAAANEKIDQTMIQFFPKLTVDAGYTRVSNVVTSFGGLVAATNAGPLRVGNGNSIVDSGSQPVTAVPFVIPTVENQWSLEGHLSIPVSDYILRVADAAASSKAGRESARIEVAAEKLKVAADAEKLYFNWLRARGQVAISRAAVERSRARLQDARATFAVGSISKADLLRIEALVANTELTLNDAESNASLTTGQLAIVMEDWHPNYRVGEGIPEPRPTPEGDVSLNLLIHEAQAHRLEMLAVESAISANSHGASATRSGALPRIDAFGDGFYANPNPRYFPRRPTGT